LSGPKRADAPGKLPAPEPTNEPADQPAAEPAPRRTMEFRRRRHPAMPAEQSKRQSDLVESAWRHFRESGPMIAFLNTHHEGLDALPLHLAIDSDEGLERVHKLLQDMSLRT
jgi:hypothetical protein